MNTDKLEENLMCYLKDNKYTLKTKFGEFKLNEKRLGQGGNAVVYNGKINEKKIAIKFLVQNINGKNQRFMSEYFNINYKKYKLLKIVNMIHYDELRLSDDITIPYIIMTEYKENLKKYRSGLSKVNSEDIIKLYNFLCVSVKSLHDNNIVHRDIKPENVLVDEKGEYYLADFGIAHFDNDEFPMDNKTKVSDRLANRDFSAPEQINKGEEVTRAADIFAIGQMLYWMVWGTVYRGTGAKSICSKLDDERAEIFHEIINICIRREPKERFLSIQHLEEYYDNKLNREAEYDPYDDMKRFADAVCSVVPEFDKELNFIEDKKEIEKLFNCIFSKEYRRDIQINYGNGNGAINKVAKLGNGDFLIEEIQVNIKKVWGYFTSNLYDDILIIETIDAKPYIIDGEKYEHVVVINNESIQPYDVANKKYIRTQNGIINSSNLELQERFIDNSIKVMAIAPVFNSTIFLKNDSLIIELNNKTKLTKNDLLKLKKEMRRVKESDL